MGKFSTLLQATGLAVTVAMPATAQDASTVLATVGGTDITLGHVIVAKSNLPEQFQSIPAPQLLEGVLEQLVSQIALSQLPGVEETLQMKLVLENERNAYLAESAIQGPRTEPVPAEDIEAAYAAQFAGFVGSEEFNAAHILLETEEEALEVVKMLESGDDFATLAKEKSTGPSGPNGGQLGWFGRGAMVPEFEAAVLELADGAISAPVQTQFGWHVVKRIESRTQNAPTLEEVRSDIETELRTKRIRAYVQAAVDGANVTRPEIEIDPELINRTDLLVK